MADAKGQRTDRVDPAVQAMNDAIELLENLKHELSDEKDKKSFELAVIALRYTKGSLYDV